MCQILAQPSVSNRIANDYLTWLAISSGGRVLGINVIKLPKIAHLLYSTVLSSRMSDEIIPDQNTKQDKCGIVMPISETLGYPAEHWEEVLAILQEVASGSGFDANLVSNADHVGISQKRIIENLYFNEIVICDVSSKNPNVMFELGIRLAFDKPTIIIKDHVTDYSFDTAPIEHLTYPKDLNYPKIVKFQKALKEKLVGVGKIQSRSDCHQLSESFRIVSCCDP